jgi:hypothetical protein
MTYRGLASYNSHTQHLAAAAAAAASQDGLRYMLLNKKNLLKYATVYFHEIHENHRFYGNFLTL